jgi:hypothetical protein
MGDIYIGDYNKIGEYREAVSNKEDHTCMFNFDACKFHVTDDAVIVGLHCTDISGLNAKSTCKPFPTNIAIQLHRKPYEYESGYGENKKKATIEPSTREKLLIKYLTDEESACHYSKVEGQSGFIAFGKAENDAAILSGEGNAKKYQRMVLGFDGEGSGEFKMDGDTFRLDVGTSQGKGKGGSSRPAETEAQKIEARGKAIEAMVRRFKALPDDAKDEVVAKALDDSMRSPNFLVLVSLTLGLPIPSLPKDEFF